MDRIILRAQKMTLKQFADMKKPFKSKPFKKVFFQCELRSFEEGAAVFGLIAYGGYKKSGKLSGPKVDLIDVPHGDRVVDTWPLAFGNMEFKFRKIQSKLAKKIADMIKDKATDMEKVVINFEPGVSKNPHVDYTITLGTSTEELNPCPPTPPSDY